MVSKMKIGILTMLAMKKSPLLLLMLFAFFSCLPETNENVSPVKFDGTGYKPIYASADQVADIEFTTAKPLTEPGKIYVLEPYLFINEMGKGIHIINNSDPKNPENLSFIAITGNYDMAAKDNWLYADNLSNLLVFDISDPKAPKLTKKIADAIPVNNYPPYQNIYFECVESKKGVVIGWEKVPMSQKPRCYR
jgi:hypothetical protein